MTTTIKTGWLKDKNGDKFAPKTLTSQIQTNDGVLLEDKIQANLDAAKDYTNTEIANLVNSAPETLDTIGELAEAFQENKDVINALDSAITNKADKEDLKNVAYIDPADSENVSNPDISASEITIDGAMSTTSTNPVQNKVITQIINSITLKKHTDGLIYIFINDEPVGEGIEFYPNSDGNNLTFTDDGNGNVTIQNESGNEINISDDGNGNVMIGG